ncbi:hypothetical protein, partial [Acinetobacter indicus]|uniref:hypothetical protein n=1 Tax=Acinetobacter indicus TaxID=756892 RepID=UPI001C09A60D
SSVPEAGLNKLNNSALRASFVSVYLVGMGCILEDFRIIASPNSLYFSRMYLFSTKQLKKPVFHLFFAQFKRKNPANGIFLLSFFLSYSVNFCVL